MCTFLVFVLISRLANGFKMGNKTSRKNMNTPNDSKSVLKSIISEEDYLPMPRNMRKTLLRDRKLQRVLPRRVLIDNYKVVQNYIDLPKEDKPSGNADGKKVESDQNIEVSNITNSSSAISVGKSESRKVTFITDTCEITPVVTVVGCCRNEIEEKSRSLPNARINENNRTGVYSSFSSPRKCHVTNRKYSLINMRTGLKKSRFTLDLEDRLRKSKLELGFDAHLSGWKEFTYKVETPKADEKTKLFLDRTMQEITKNTGCSEKVSDGRSSESVQYCTRNCQILGLCSLEKPQVFSNKKRFEHIIFGDEILTEGNVDSLIENHCKKEGCPCDLCTLAYLTNMNCHDGREINVKPISRNNLWKSDDKNIRLKEKIKIIDSKNGKKSIEVCVRSKSPDTQSSFTNCSNMSMESTVDFTNSRIRHMFRKNDLPDDKDIQEIYTNPNSTYDDHSVDKILCNSPEHVSSLTTKLCTQKKLVSQSSLRSKHRNYSSSTMTESFASSSSLSTIMSYKRVRHIFQSIIEGTRTRKRTRLEVLKFKEMEDLGLGKFRNNRWYPSDCKAFSIWKNMQENVQGFQGEFKKYQKQQIKIY